MKPKRINSVIKNKSEELWRASPSVQSTTSKSFTVPAMQQSRLKSYRTGHHSSKKKLIEAYL